MYLYDYSLDGLFNRSILMVRTLSNELGIRLMVQCGNYVVPPEITIASTASWITDEDTKDSIVNHPTITCGFVS